jgi:outer membrane protein assembly factor BamB
MSLQPTLVIAVAVASMALGLGVTSGGLGTQGEAGVEAWRQWGGPNRDFLVNVTGLADSWPAEGPPVIWMRPLGTGHSAILADGDRLFTMYRRGDGRNRSGPWEAEETVVAMDAATGTTIWEYTYDSGLEDFSFGSGPHATPLVVGNRLFTTGTNKQLHAFDTRTGALLWSHDLIRDFNAPPLLIRPRVKSGYACSLLAYRDLVICQVGGPGQSVMAFRQSDGSVAWKSGNFLVSQAPQLLITVDGQEQLVVFAGQTVNGLDPDTGAVLWSQPHDAGNDFNFMLPLWGDDNILFVSSGYIAGSQAFRLSRQDSRTDLEPLWFNSQVKFMFLNPIRLGDHVYGTDGTFGPAFLTAIDIKTGEPVWRERGFGRASMLHADGKAIIMDEDGDLALVRLTPEGPTILARATVFDTTSWTVPTLVGTTLYARDREKIVAFDLGAH